MWRRNQWARGTQTSCDCRVCLVQCDQVCWGRVRRWGKPDEGGQAHSKAEVPRNSPCTTPSLWNPPRSGKDPTQIAGLSSVILDKCKWAENILEIFWVCTISGGHRSSSHCLQRPTRGCTSQEGPAFVPDHFGPTVKHGSSFVPAEESRGLALCPQRHASPATLSQPCPGRNTPKNDPVAAEWPPARPPSVLPFSHQMSQLEEILVLINSASSWWASLCLGLHVAFLCVCHSSSCKDSNHMD